MGTVGTGGCEVDDDTKVTTGGGVSVTMLSVITLMVLATTSDVV